MREIIYHVKWLVSLVKKFFRVVPVSTITSVISSNVAQVSLILAFFLPLKVILLLGSNAIPTYFPAFLKRFPLNELVIVLSIASAVFYCSFLLFERLVVQCNDRGVNNLLKNNNQLLLSDSRRNLAIFAYRRTVSILSSASFAVLGVLSVSLLYPKLVPAITIFVASIFFITLVASMHNKRVWTVLKPKVRGYCSIVSALGFLFVFAIIVNDFLAGRGTHVFPAVISLLLVRQLFNKLASAVVHFIGVCERSRSIETLFFSSSVVNGEVLINDHDEFWSEFSVEKIVAFAKDLDLEKKYAGIDFSNPRWVQTGVRDCVLVGFDVSSTLIDKNDFEVLIKIFGSNRADQAMIERQIFVDGASQNLPAPAYHSGNKMGKYYCNVFTWRPGSTLNRKEFKKNIYHIFACQMMVNADQWPENRKTRRYPALQNRISENMLSRLSLAAKTRNMSDELEIFKSSLPRFTSLLSGLPLQLVNGHISYNTVYEMIDGSYNFIHWGDWKLEPVGASWPIAGIGSQKLEEYFSVILKKRECLKMSDLPKVKLAALASRFEKLCESNRLNEALKLVKRMNVILSTQCDGELQTKSSSPQENIVGASLKNL